MLTCAPTIAVGRPGPRVRRPHARCAPRHARGALLGGREVRFEGMLRGGRHVTALEVEVTYCARAVASDIRQAVEQLRKHFPLGCFNIEADESTTPGCKHEVSRRASPISVQTTGFAQRRGVAVGVTPIFQNGALGHLSCRA